MSMDVLPVDQRAQDYAARLARMLAIRGEAQAWQDRPIAEAFDHFTRGLGRPERGRVGFLALEFVVAWATTPPDQIPGHFSVEQMGGLPPLDDALSWAAFRVGAVAAAQIAEASDPPAHDALTPAA